LVTEGVGDADGLSGVELGVVDTDGIGVLLIDGVPDDEGVTDTLGVTDGLADVALGVRETDGKGVLVTEGVFDIVAVTLGDRDTTRTGHSRVYSQHGSSSRGFSIVTYASRLLGQANLTVTLPVSDVSIVGYPSGDKLKPL